MKRAKKHVMPYAQREMPRAAVNLEKLKQLGIAFAIGLGTFLLFLPTLRNDFVNFDDPFYVTENPIVQQGLTFEGIRWAFTTNHFFNWLPVTWLSHMLDCQMWGTEPAGHHFTSIFLHAVNAVIVFLFVSRATGRTARAVIVAALFAVHPLRVESVAWIAERKDVLCGTSFLLMLLSYVAYARRPSAWRFVLVGFFHAMALMSKTMAVTAPAVLLLLDYWPLRRWRAIDSLEGEPPAIAAPASARWLIVEKLPLVFLSIIASAWTIGLQGQGGGGALSFGQTLTIGQRLGNAAVSVPRYLYKMVWPANLSVFYPHPGSWPAWQVWTSVLLIVALTAAAIYFGRRRRFIAVGWFWFFGMLLPVLGILQAGTQSIADRYLYLPSIGLCITVVWIISEAANRRREFQPLMIAVSSAVILILAVVTALQQRHWVSTFDLFQHALAVDERNYLANGQVGVVYQNRGDDVTAIRYFQRAIDLNPDYPNAHHNLGRSLVRLKRYDEAIEQLRVASRLDPSLALTHHLLGIVYFDRQQFAPAAEEFGAAVRLEPGNGEIHSRFGAALLMLGKNAEAVQEFNQALKINPQDARARGGMSILSGKGLPSVTGPVPPPAR